MLYRVLNAPQNRASGNMIFCTVDDKNELATGLMGQLLPKLFFISNIVLNENICPSFSES